MSKADGQLDTKLVELGDDFSLLVPMNWTCAWLDDGRWQCGDRDGIFQCYFRHEIAPPSDPPTYPLDHAQRCLDIMRRWLEEHGTIGGIDRAEYGAIIAGEVDAAGAAEQQLVWYYLIPVRTRYLVAGFELAIPSTLRDRADMVEAKAVMAREIGKLRLEFDDED